MTETKTPQGTPGGVRDKAMKGDQHRAFTLAPVGPKDVRSRTCLIFAVPRQPTARLSAAYDPMRRCQLLAARAILVCGAVRK